MTESIPITHHTCKHPKQLSHVTYSKRHIPFNPFSITTSWNIRPCRVCIGLTAVFVRSIRTLKLSHLFGSKDSIVSHLSAYDSERPVSCQVLSETRFLCKWKIFFFAEMYNASDRLSSLRCGKLICILIDVILYV